ncbi:MAG: response regulator transcription factor [Planctomycetota bacterium]|jgi:DNA-binding response OmpR family regulator
MTSGTDPIRAAHVLVVEDDPMSRDFIVRLLAEEGIETDAVPDGPACLARLEDADRRRPDLILLDVSMPGMSGLEVLDWIRRRHDAADLPVVMVSALVEISDVVAALDRGADDYLTKPVHPALLMARVTTALQRRRGVAGVLESRGADRVLEALARIAAAAGPSTAALHRRLESLAAAAPAPVDPAELGTMLDDARHLDAIITRLAALAEARGPAVHAGIAAVIDATLEQIRPPADDAPDASDGD